jgi:Putative adhesin
MATELRPPPTGPAVPVRTADTVGPGVALLRACGLLLTLAIVATVAGSLVAQFFQRTVVETSTLGPDVARVVTDVETGTVRVRVGPPGSAVRVTTTRRWSFRAPTTSSTVVAGTARLTARCDQGFTLVLCSVDLDVVVPPGTDLELTVGTGQVVVDGADGQLRVAVATGDVAATALHSSAVQAAVTTGDLRLSFVSAPSNVAARTTTGDVTVTLPAGERYRVHDSSTVGTRSVSVPTDPAATRTIEVSTTVGDVRVRTG